MSVCGFVPMSALPVGPEEGVGSPELKLWTLHWTGDWLALSPSARWCKGAVMTTVLGPFLCSFRFVCFMALESQRSKAAHFQRLPDFWNCCPDNLEGGDSFALTTLDRAQPELGSWEEACVEGLARGIHGVLLGDTGAVTWWTCSGLENAVCRR